MKMCYVGKNLKQCGIGNIFKNDVCAFVTLGHEVQTIDTTIQEFELSQIDPDVELVLVSADVEAAQKIGQSNKLKKTLLFIHGRADGNFDPQEYVNYSALKLMAQLNSISQTIGFAKATSYLWSKLKRAFSFQGDSYRGVNLYWLNAIRRFQSVVVPSNLFGNQLKHSLGINYWKIPYGLDHSYWKPDKDYTTCEEHVRIIIPTGFFLFKRLNIGLRKINYVIKELEEKICVEADFIWYNADLKELKDKIQECYPNITFKDGTSDPKKLFSKYDLVAHPSLGDTVPQTVVECCALGLPVLASTLSEDCIGSHLLHIRTTDPGYEDALRMLILNAELRLELSKRARSFARKWIGWEDRARMILELGRNI